MRNSLRESVAREKSGSGTELRERYGSCSIPELFLKRVKSTPDKVAFRKKELGIYQEVTWGEYGQRVEAFCLGLIELGLQREDRVAVLGDPCPEWLYADMAIQSAGGITFGIYPTSSPSEVRHFMQNSGARILVAQNQMHVDKILAVVEQLSELEHIIVVDTTAMFAYDDHRLTPFTKVEEMGKQRKTRDPGLFEERVAMVSPDDVSTIIYTSGTSGVPKGAMLSHRNLINGSVGMLDTFHQLKHKPQRLVTFLPLAHALEKAVSGYLPTIVDFVPHFGENLDSVQETIFEVSPGVLCVPPRFWQKWAAQVLTGIETSSWIKKAAYNWAMGVGRSYVSAQRKGNGVPMALKLLYGLAYLTVFRPILDKVGLKQVDFAVAIGAPVSPKMVILWQVWGVKLREGFGLTEAGGFVSMQVDDLPMPGNAGKVLPGYEMRLSDEGELLLRGPSIFKGYWRNEEAARQAVVDGWLHTGDVVQFIDDENFKIVDRIKDIAITAGGKNISPSEIERALKASPYVSEAVVFADGRKFPSALIEIDYDTVSEWARSNGVLYTSYTSLVEHPRVCEQLEKEVENVNAELARVEQVKKFRIIPKELDPEEEGDPVTATRKVRRKQMYERFKELVESMYGGEEEALIEAEVGELEETILGNQS